MTFWTYMLRCADGTYYTGHTDNLERRVAQHMSGEYRGYTHDRRPLELIWSQDFGSRAEALDAELRVKSWARAKKEALAAGDWERLRLAAAPPSERKEGASTSLGQPPRLRSGRTDGEDGSPGSASPQDERSGLAGSDLGDGITPSQPAIVLVRPQLGENIGKAARAMLNFGLTDLRLVSPRDGWPNPSAGPAASGADMVLENARLYDSVADAVADCAHVYATTVRKRGVIKPVMRPDQAAIEIRGNIGGSAILFGPERSGLETDDVAVARTILTVPINPEFGSLNLAQAVILVAYEWSKGADLVQPSITEILPPAPQAEFDGMFAQLDDMLIEAGYYFPPDRRPTTRRMLRTLLTKPGWDSQEVRTMRGIFSAFAKPKRR